MFTFRGSPWFCFPILTQLAVTKPLQLGTPEQTFLVADIFTYHSRKIKKLYVCYQIENHTFAFPALHQHSMAIFNSGSKKESLRLIIKMQFFFIFYRGEYSHTKKLCFAVNFISLESFVNKLGCRVHCSTTVLLKATVADI